MEQVKTIKCVVWDLDDTLWKGVLAEENVVLRPDALDVVKALDGRGILQSVASRNDHDVALAQLQSFGLGEYFLIPQINWGRKSVSLQTLAERLNLNVNTFAFVDNDPFEREEISFSHPSVLVLDGAAPLRDILGLPCMMPRFITGDSSRRSRMYREDFVRQAAQESFAGPAEVFFESLDMRLCIAPVAEDDLERAEELTERTHQLNTSGVTYSYQDLNTLRHSSNHLLLIADLNDRFGQYGRIGLAVIERRAELWVLKLLIVSCRVMSRGVGSVLLQDVMRRARGAGVRLRAEFRDTGRNRVMMVTLRFAGFREVEEAGTIVTLEHDLRQIPEVPAYIMLKSV